MNHFTGKDGLPQLLASGALQCEVSPGVTHYLVMSPMGQLLGKDTDPELVRIVFRDVASTIRAINVVGILHRWVGRKSTNLRLRGTFSLMDIDSPIERTGILIHDAIC